MSTRWQSGLEISQIACPHAPFHIAYYIGTLSVQDPTAGFHIISKDSGFDALIRHLAGKGIVVCRSAGIAGIPRPTPHPALDTQVQTAVKDLIHHVNQHSWESAVF
jgi:hypothetical protein